MFRQTTRQNKNAVAAFAAAAAVQVVELDPGNAWAAKTVATLTPEVQVCGYAPSRANQQ
jgi:hypothetical protein